MDGDLVEKRTGYLELFFDLVFVFAVTQLVAVLEHDHGPGGWLHTVLLAWLMWWAWSQFAWAGNAIDLDRPRTRVAVLALTGVTLLVAAALPEALSADGGLRFAVPYAVVRFAGLALFGAGSGDDPVRRAALRAYLPLALVSPAVVLVGGAAPPAARPWIWAAAVLLDVASAVAGGRGEFRIAPAHFAERHALVVIIALGESIVGIGVTVASSTLTPAVLGATSAAFVLLAAQWWGYFDWVQAASEHRLAGESDLRLRGRLARDLFTFCHFPIVLGCVVVAFGLEVALAHPTERLGPAGLVALGAGLALFSAGFVAGNARATGTVFVERVVALVVVAALTVLAGPRVPAVVLLGALALSLLALARLEGVRRRARSAAPV